MSIRSVYGFVSHLVDLLLIDRGGERYFWRGADDEMEDLVSDLRSLHNLIETLDEERQQHGVHYWVRETEKICYDLEDYLVETQTRIQKQTITDAAVALGNSLCLGFIRSLSNNNEILRMEEDRHIYMLRLKIKHMIRLGQIEISSVAGLQKKERPRPFVFDKSSSSSRHEDDLVVGLEDERDRLVSRLIENKSEEGEKEFCPLIVIQGISGLGKTTLARRLYDHPQVRRHFQAFAWITVGMEYDLRTILGLLLKQLAQKTTEEDYCSSSFDFSDIWGKIQRIQMSVRCLIVVDDVRGIESWCSLGQYCFPLEPPTLTGSKILLTTGLLKTTNFVTSSEIYQLRHMTQQESLELFARRAFMYPSPPSPDSELHEMSARVVRGCEGIPLAVNVIGRLLATKHTLSEWQVVLDAVESCHAIHNPDRLQKLEEGLLSLCYDDLSETLKRCFLYLGLFPDNSDIEVEKLYQLWMAEGFIQPESEGAEMTMMDVAEQYLDELSARGLVEVDGIKVPSIRRFRSCHLHVMMLALCRRKAKEENLFQVLNSCYVFEISKYPKSIGNTRRLALYIGKNVEGEGLCFQLEKIGLLRSLFLKSQQSQERSAEFLDSLEIKLFLLLRVLNFDSFDCRGSDVLGDIGKLTSLKYLSFRECHLEKLPLSLGELLNLQTLDLRAVKDQVISLPNVIWKLKCLKHLYLPSKFNIQEDDKLRLDSLEKLETLQNFDTRVCSTIDLLFLMNLHELTASMEGNVEDLHGIIKRLNMIPNRLCQTSLRIKFFNMLSVEERSLAIRQLIECSYLHMLHIKGIIGALPQIISSNLTKMIFSGSELVEDPMPILERFPNLCVLVLCHRAFLGRELVISSSGFCQLRYLMLSNLHKLEILTIKEGAMPKLCALKVEGCRNLKELPELGSPTRSEDSDEIFGKYEAF